MDALLQFSKMYESTLWGDAMDSRSSYTNDSTSHDNATGNHILNGTTSISSVRGMTNLTDYDFQQIADNSRDGFNWAVKQFSLNSNADDDYDSEEDRMHGPNGKSMQRSLSDGANNNASHGKKRTVNGVTRSQTSHGTSYSKIVSDKAADGTTPSSSSVSLSSSVTSPRSKVVPTRRLARKPFEKIMEVDTRLENSSDYHHNSNTNNHQDMDENTIVTPAKHETVASSSSSTTTGKTTNGKNTRALFTFTSKENRTKKSVSYSAVAKGMTTTTTTTSSSTVEIVAQSVTDIEATLNTTAEDDEQTEEKVIENIVVPETDAGTATDDFVPVKKVTTPRGAADKKRRIELRRASNGGVSRTNSSSSTTTHVPMETTPTTTVAPIKKPQTTWTIPAATGPAWNKKSSTSTPVTPIEVPVVESSTPKAATPVVTVPISRTSSAVSTTSTAGKTNFASFAAAVSRQQSLKSNNHSNSNESTLSSVPSISLTALETTHNLSTPSTPVLSSTSTNVPLTRTLTRSSTGTSGSWVNVVGTAKSVDPHNTSALDLDTSIVSNDNDGNTSVMTNDSKIQRTTIIEPLTEKKLARRQKDIDMGKAVKGYSNYIAAVPVNKRDPRKREHPVTPDRNKEMSKRVWDISVANWKARLHLWDDNNPKEALAKLAASSDPTENASADVPTVRRNRRVEPVQISSSLSSTATSSPSLLAYQSIVLQKVEETTNDDI